jgi:hypothetical protein
MDGVEMGTTQLLSVPYALHAGKADSVRIEKQILSMDGNTLSISQGNSIDLPMEEMGNGSGNYIVVITCDISTQEASDCISTEVGTNTRSIWIYSTTELTELLIENVHTLFEVKIENNFQLTSLSFPNLKTVGELIIERNKLLATLTFDSLKTCKGINLTMTSLSSLNLP